MRTSFRDLRDYLISSTPVLSDEEYLSLATSTKTSLRELFPRGVVEEPFAAELPQSAKFDDFSRNQSANIVKLRSLFVIAANEALARESFCSLIDSIPSIVCASSIYYNCIPIEQTLIFKDNTTFRLDGRVKFFKFISKFPLPAEASSLLEEIRLAQSRISPNRRIEGTLTLSILPEDYLTLSDNTTGWTSCLRTFLSSVKGTLKRGDYCSGTLEMLSSPYCFVASIKSSEGRKYWRQLFLYTPYAIIALRPYPYELPQATERIFTITRDLALKASRTYLPQIILSPNECISLPNNSSTALVTSLMYNDAIRGIEYILRQPDEIPSSVPQYLNFSGTAHCLSCGSPLEIAYLDNGEEHLECPNCLGLRKCYCCGEWVSHTQEKNGYEVCDYCFQDLEEEFPKERI